MRSARFWIKSCLAVTLAGGCAVAVAHGATDTVEGIQWTYTVSGGTATVDSVPASTSGVIVIPSSLGGYPVTDIGMKAFENCRNLTSVTIPACVTNIGILSSFSDAVNAFDSYWGAYPTLSFAFAGCSGLVDIHVAGDNPVYASKGGVLFSKDGKTLLFCPNGKTGSYSVPEGVLQIGDGVAYHGHHRYVWGWPAFAGCTKLTQVTIPDGVEVIDDRSFEDCSGLTSIAIPDSVTDIGVDAFGDCSGMTSISIGSGVEKIGESAFWGCSGLTAVHVHDLAAWCNLSFYPYNYANPLSYAHHLFLDGEEVTNLMIPSGVTGIPDCAFSGCSGLTTVTIPSGVKNIGWQAFSGCSGLTRVTIPDSVTDIGYSAFSGCSGLTSVTIPNSVTNIEYSAFSGCSGMQAFSVASGNPTYQSVAGLLLTKDGKTLLHGVNGNVVIPDSVTSIGWQAFSGCSGLTSVTIPNSVTNIEYSAFSGCSGMQAFSVASGNPTYQSVAGLLLTKDGKTLIYGVNGDVVIPDSVTIIDDSAFYNCSGLTSVTIPDSVTSIGWNAFSGCSGLTSVTIPASVTSIGFDAFWKCSGLTSVTIPASVTDIGNSAFSGCSGMRAFSVASGNPSYRSQARLLLTKDGKTLLYGVNGDVVIPDSVTSIGAEAFSGCSGLRSVTIPDSVTSIESEAFSGCSGLRSVTIPDSVTSIGYDAFSGCSDLTSVTIGECVTSIGDGAFSGCAPALFDTNTIPGVRLVDGWAVGISESLTDALELTGVRGVADGAFSGCSGLTSVTIPDSVTSIGPAMFSGCSGLTNVTIPDSVTRIARSAFYGCSGLTSVTIPASVTSIGYDAFGGCSGLTSVMIPDSVTYLGHSAFSACSRLTNVTIGNSVTSITEHAFYNCSSLASVTIPDSVTIIEDSAFYNCSGLTSVTIPDSVKRIGYDAFSGCRSLTNVTFGNSVTRIEDYAFSGCSGLISVTIPASVTNIGYFAFGRCDALQILYVPDSWKSKDEEGDFWTTHVGVPEWCTVVYGSFQPQLMLAAVERSFSASAAGAQELGVTANVSWTTQSSATWLAVKTASGSGNGTIRYDVAANTGTVARTGAITVNGGGLTRTFTVTQDGVVATLELGAASRTFASDAASGMELSVAANVSWTAESAVAWLTLKTSGGNGDGTITYDVATNPGTGERMGAITVSGGGLTRIFLVTQSGKTETQRTPVGVPCQWLEENASGILAAAGGDYETAAMAPAANGLPVWKCYVAGLSTTDVEAEFKVKSISLADGELQVEWTPDLNDNGTKTNRIYVIQGKQSMDDEWGEKTPGSRFFRVRVGLPEP